MFFGQMSRKIHIKNNKKNTRLNMFHSLEEEKETGFSLHHHILCACTNVMHQVQY